MKHQPILFAFCAALALYPLTVLVLHIGLTLPPDYTWSDIAGDWVTIIAGLIALVAAGATVWQMQRQMTAAREIESQKQAQIDFSKAALLHAELTKHASALSDVARCIQEVLGRKDVEWKIAGETLTVTVLSSASDESDSSLSGMSDRYAKAVRKITFEPRVIELAADLAHHDQNVVVWAVAWHDCLAECLNIYEADEDEDEWEGDVRLVYLELDKALTVSRIPDELPKLFRVVYFHSKLCRWLERQFKFVNTFAV